MSDSIKINALKVENLKRVQAKTPAPAPSATWKKGVF